MRLDSSLYSRLILFLGLGLGVVDGKSGGGDYRKRSKPLECAKEKGR